MRRNPFRPGSLPSLPGYFPGANERVEGIEVPSGGDHTSLEEDRDEPAFLDSGRMKISLPSKEERSKGRSRGKDAT